MCTLDRSWQKDPLPLWPSFLKLVTIKKFKSNHKENNEQILSEANFYKLHVHYYSKEGKLEKFSFPEGAGGDMMINRQVICGVGGWREEDPGTEMVS